MVVLGEQVKIMHVVHRTQGYNIRDKIYNINIPMYIPNWIIFTI